MNSAATTSKAPIIVATVKDQDRTRFGRKIEGDVLEDTTVRVVEGVSIEIQKTVRAGSRYVKNAVTGRYEPSTTDVVVTKRFAIGDIAEVGSYNLVYTGVVRGITAKTVTVIEYEGTGCEKTYRMSLYRFVSRNWDFDAAEASKRNAEWTD